MNRLLGSTCVACCIVVAGCAASESIGPTAPTKTGGLAAMGRAASTGDNRTADRSLVDRDDDLVGHQVKILYVVPADRTDRELDLDGTLLTSVTAFHEWLMRASSGRQIKLDTHQGQLDITFVRLAVTDGELMSFGVRQRDALERVLNEMGFAAPNKMYAAYYDGGHTVTCADAFRPLGLTGNVVAVYLQFIRAEGNGRTCEANNPFARSAASPGYLEFSMVHEIVHGLGFVASCAPHFVSGHVNDDPTDLMYAGPLPWHPTTIDVNRDDYFRHGSSCLDLDDSPYIR